MCTCMWCIEVASDTVVICVNKASSSMTGMGQERAGMPLFLRTGLFGTITTGVQLGSVCAAPLMLRSSVEGCMVQETENRMIVSAQG